MAVLADDGLCPRPTVFIRSGCQSAANFHLSTGIAVEKEAGQTGIPRQNNNLHLRQRSACAVKRRGRISLSQFQRRLAWQRES